MGDFSGQNLRGRNFQGQDLHAVSFSYADIQGADFSGANLQGADFSGAKAGLQKRYVAIQLVLACLMCGLCGLLVGYFSSWFSFYFEVDYINKYGLRPGIAYVYSLGMIIIAIVCYGFTTKTLLTIGISNVSVVAVATIIGITSVETYEAVSIAVVGIATLSIGVAVGVAGSSASSISNAANNKTIKWLSIFASACIGILGGVFGAVAGGRSGASKSYGVAAGTVSIGCAIVVSVVPNLLGTYIAWRVMRDDNKFALIRKFAIVFSSLGGTRFYSANLTGAKFANAILENTNLCAANLTHVYWKNAYNLHRARLGTSILADRKVLELLTTGYGVNKDLSNLNLRGTNLDSATLNGANLKNTDFSQARLRKVDLQNANLTELS
jgi:uncharacterized protein YjbI with pentapeptide repeats